jgi:single-strand DNA-binding protein
MRGINRLFIMGNVGIQPKIQKSKNDNSYTDLRLATHRNIKKGDKWSEITDWHDIRIWGEDAVRCCRLLQPGDTVAVDGSLRTDSWINEAGEKTFSTGVVCKAIHFVRLGHRQKVLSLSA